MVYVSYLPSLRALPLFKVKKLCVNYGLFDYSTSKEVPRVLTQSHYADVARLLDLNQLNDFTLIPNYDHEPDNILTIQPFALAIAKQNTLDTFSLPRYAGVANIEYLLMNGIAPNQSIKSLSYGQIYGDMPVVLMGRMLSKNRTLTSLYMSCEKLRDLECLNELGKGLEQNSTLQHFTLNIYYLASPHESNPFYIKSLPGRNSNSYPVNLEPFKKALISYRGTLSLKDNSSNKEIGNLFEIVNLERAKHKKI